MPSPIFQFPVRLNRNAIESGCLELGLCGSVPDEFFTEGGAEPMRFDGVGLDL